MSAQVEMNQEVSTLSRLAKKATLIALALGLTVGISQLDSVRQDHNQSALALRWARQMIVQAQTLSLTASEKGNTDPLSWAARLLSQGTDSRILYVAKFHPDKTHSTSDDSAESYKLDQDSGIFEYSKITIPEEQLGLKIKLYTSKLGIFGAKSRLGQDLTLASLFFVAFALMHLLTTPKKIIDEALIAAGNRASQFKTQVQDWLIDAKKALIELSIHIREMTRAAHQLSGSAVRAQGHLNSLKVDLNSTLVALRAKPKNLNELTTVAKDAEEVFKTADENTKTLIRKLMTVALKNASISGDIEKQLEHLVEECDQAFNSLQEVGISAQSMSTEITRTTHGMLQQSRMISDLKSRGA